MFVTTEGKAYWIKVHEIPEGTRNSKGSHLKALMAITPDEDVTAVVTFRDFEEGLFVFMGTSRGVVKKVELPLFRNAKTRGIAAIKLDDGDKLIRALLTTGDKELMIISKRGLGLRFSEKQVRAMGRATRGVTGIRLSVEDEVASILLVQQQELILVVTENGLGKRVEFDSFSVHSRATKGQICYRLTDKSGEIAGAVSIGDDHDFMCVTLLGQSIRIDSSTIPIQGRNTSGVIVTNIHEPDRVVSVAQTERYEEEDEETV
jgi:DNA gyrase subunit A